MKQWPKRVESRANIPVLKWVHVEVKKDLFKSTVEEILQNIADLERQLSSCLVEAERRSLEKSLKRQNDRFERMIPYPFRMQLQLICKEAGIDTAPID